MYLYLKDYRESKREKIFHLLYDFLNDHKGWNSADLKHGAGELFCVSHVGAGAQELQPSSATFPSHEQRAALEVEQPNGKVCSCRWRVSSGPSASSFALFIEGYCSC